MNSYTPVVRPRSWDKVCPGLLSPTGLLPKYSMQGLWMWINVRSGKYPAAGPSSGSRSKVWIATSNRQPYQWDMVSFKHVCYFKILNLRLVAGNFIGILNQDFWGINLGSVYIQGLNLMKIQWLCPYAPYENPDDDWADYSANHHSPNDDKKNCFSGNDSSILLILQQQCARALREGRDQEPDFSSGNHSESY